MARFCDKNLNFKIEYPALVIYYSHIILTNEVHKTLRSVNYHVIDIVPFVGLEEPKTASRC